MQINWCVQASVFVDVSRSGSLTTEKGAGRGGGESNREGRHCVAVREGGRWIVCVGRGIGERREIAVRGGIDCVHGGGGGV